jgi:hypothetical protein
MIHINKPVMTIKKNLLSTSLCIAVVSLGVSSCSTMVSGKHQAITLEADCNGVPTVAKCTLRNEHGSWITNTPNTLIIQKGFGDLIIDCTSPSFSRHTAYIPSKAEWSNYGNIASLGVLSFVDVQNGAGYRYPEHYKFSINQCIPYKTW